MAGLNSAQFPKITKNREAVLPQVCALFCHSPLLFCGMRSPGLSNFTLRFLRLNIFRSFIAHSPVVYGSRWSSHFFSNVLLTPRKSTFNKQSCVTTKWPLLLSTMAPVILKIPAFLPLACFTLAFIATTILLLLFSLNTSLFCYKTLYNNSYFLACGFLK